MRNRNIRVLLQAQNNEHWNSIHLAAYYQSAEAFQIFCETTLSRLSPEQCFTLLQAQNNNHWNSIHFAARYQSAETFQIFCETTLSRLTPEQCFTLLQAQNNNHWNSIHFAARYQSAETFQIFCETTLNRLSPEQCFTLLQAQNNDHWNSIHPAAYYQSAETFQIFCETTLSKLSSEQCFSLWLSLLQNIPGKYNLQKTLKNNLIFLFITLERITNLSEAKFLNHVMQFFSLNRDKIITLCLQDPFVLKYCLLLVKIHQPLEPILTPSQWSQLRTSLEEQR